MFQQAKRLLTVLIMLGMPVPIAAQSVEERAYGLPGDPGLDDNGVRINRPAPIENPFATPAYDGPPSPRSADALLRASRVDELLRAEAEAAQAAAERDRRVRDVYVVPRYRIGQGHGSGLHLGLKYSEDDGLSGHLTIGSPWHGQGYYHPKTPLHWPKPEPQPTRPLQ
ncbi:hypothetical protein [Ovoidimarina sediminis]|uniref:hypothetical protein n=1 Tax=Ovoidimarina sediminis TaxID=3079856 RepID=UPI002914B5AE|nr:hypothetical protein [Rhodophyticola sp. MJ-SS7]MDU8943905.1 hypothetical protein [Rhodophyticola sp. MJ-SS7]